MGKKHSLTIDLPDELLEKILEKIEEYKKQANLPDNSSAIKELLEHALFLPKYFRDFDWRKAEDEADEDIRQGNVKSFSTVEDFLKELYE